PVQEHHPQGPPQRVQTAADESRPPPQVGIGAQRLFGGNTWNIHASSLAAGTPCRRLSTGRNENHPSPVASSTPWPATLRRRPPHENARGNARTRGTGNERSDDTPPTDASRPLPVPPGADAHAPGGTGRGRDASVGGVSSLRS